MQSTRSRLDPPDFERRNATRLAIVAGALKYCSDKAIFTCDSKHGAQMFHTAHKKVLPGIKFYREQLPHRDDAAEALEENWNGFQIVTWYELRYGSLNFIKLCKLKYYNFSCFHSIEEGYIAQTGDPTGSGRGGNSVFCEMYGEQAKYFEAEMVPKLKHTRRGLVSMVNNGADAHGSQFFFTLADDLDYLDASKHTVFGQVSEGFETLDRLNEALCDEQHRPYQDIRLCHTLILWDPFDDPPGFVVPERSPSPTVELLKSMRLGVDEDLLDDGTGGKSGHEVEEMIAKKEAVARAHILEMIGDLHHAEERPPDNVLFVCKLNPVTCEEDLEIIFSRFGKIESAEVIRDKVSGNSLQYAFIEFETPEMCEAAYFKMDNVLIDDRRIHVDFSQSVSKNPKYVWQKLLDREKKKGGVASENNASKVTGKRKVESGHRERHADRHSTVKQSKRNNRNSPDNRSSDRDKDRRKRSRSRDRIGAVPNRKKYRSRSPRDRRDNRGDRRDFRERDRDRRR